MKKVMLYAYTGSNLGDDLFIKVLCERYPNTKFLLFAPKIYKRNFKDINNLSIIPRDSYVVRGVNFILRKLGNKNSVRSLIARRCDIGVQIGGSIFMERSGWRENTNNKRKMIFKNQPFFVLGANFGPYSDNEFYKLNREVIKKYTDICFRDEYSFQLFNDLGNVRKADDVVFQLKTKMINNKTNNIVISVIKPSYREDLEGYDNIYYEKIKDIIVTFINKGFTITLMSFCNYEGDIEAIEEIKKRIPKSYLEKVQEYLYELNIEEALDIIANSCFVVGTRFHAMILGWLYKKPVFPIAYSKKMTNVMEDINFSGPFIEFKKIHKLNVDRVVESMEKEPINVSKEINNSGKQFKILDEYLLK